MMDDFSKLTDTELSAEIDRTFDAVYQRQKTLDSRLRQLQKEQEKRNPPKRGKSISKPSIVYDEKAFFPFKQYVEQDFDGFADCIVATDTDARNALKQALASVEIDIQYYEQDLELTVTSANDLFGDLYSRCLLTDLLQRCLREPIEPKTTSEILRKLYQRELEALRRLRAVIDAKINEYEK